MLRLRLKLLFLVLACGQSLAGQFEFVVIGDTRPRFESENFRQFERLIPKINAANPALVVNLGDLIYGYGPAGKASQWGKYGLVIKAIAAPYYQVPGNHDTHSKDARRIYGQRFKKFYQSFDYGNCHFTLLDNTENERWGYLGPDQLDWLERDLNSTSARLVFVFLHFPIWEPEGLAPEYHEFWAQKLHPLFKQHRVRAVFGGHYHTYGPTREFDGIRYFITGGGGAELRPEYRKSGGDYHFVKVRVEDDTFDVQIVTENGVLADPEADLMGGLQFASRHVSRIGIKLGATGLSADIPFTVSIENPYPDSLSGGAQWLLDESEFQVEPRAVEIHIPSKSRHAYDFHLHALHAAANLESLPRLEFNVVSGGKRHRFHREVRVLDPVRTQFRAKPPLIDGDLADWEDVSPLNFGHVGFASLRTAYDDQNLYFAITTPACDSAEATETRFPDMLQIGMARGQSPTDFGGDLLRLGFDFGSQTLLNRTSGLRTPTAVPGARSAFRVAGGRAVYEFSLPLRLLKGMHAGPGHTVVADVSFPITENDIEVDSEPPANTFSYRVRFGNDSLVPVYFVELSFENKPL